MSVSDLTLLELLGNPNDLIFFIGGSEEAVHLWISRGPGHDCKCAY